MPFKGLSIQRGNFLLLFSLILNSIVWFHLIIYKGFLAAEPIPFGPSLAWLYYLAVLASMLIGPMLAGRAKKMHFLFVWIIFGIVSSLFPLILPTFGEREVAFLLVLWGFAFGIGFPSCLALIPSLTKVEERGRISGIILGPTYLIVFLFFLLFLVVKDLDISSYSLMLAGWRSFGLAPFLLHVSLHESIQPKPISYSALRNKTLVLYLLPWLLFCLVNYSGSRVIGQSFGESVNVLIGGIEFTVGALFCLVAGWLMDLKGRRLMIIIGLVVLGLGYALLSISPFISFTLGFYTIADGIAFGIFSVAFISVVWGDIANGASGDKFYALGNAPVPAAIMLSTILSSWLVELDISVAFPVASFFIFLAIIPIFFAPELLPERVLKERELKRYVEEAKKIAERG